MASADAARATTLIQVLVGRSLDQVCVGVADAQLGFTGATVSLWSLIRVPPGSETAAVRPHTLDGLTLLVPLLDGSVAAAGVSDSGELTLTIGGTTVSCGSDPDYEAWSFSGPDGETVVCTPGGSLTIWSARP